MLPVVLGDRIMRFADERVFVISYLDNQFFRARAVDGGFNWGGHVVKLEEGVTFMFVKDDG